MSKLYVTSTSSCVRLTPTINELVSAKHQVYNPYANAFFTWSDLELRIDPDLPGLSWYEDYLRALESKRLKEVASINRKAIVMCDAFVLVQDAGISTHIELGMAIGMGVPTIVLLNSPYVKVELGYAYATYLAPHMDDLLRWIENDLPGMQGSSRLRKT